MATPSKSKEIAFNGKLRTNVDGASIGPNDFQVLQNLRYTDTNVKGVQGHTKINTTVLAYTAIRNGIHFRKDQPVESHVVVEADGYCYDNTTSVPGAGDFGAALNTVAGTYTGRFAVAPTGMLARCTGNESLLWGGTEYRAAALIDYPTTNQIYDYGDIINSTLSDADHSATIHGSVIEAIDANTSLLLHTDNNVTDYATLASGYPHTVTNSNVTFSTSTKKYGTHSASFNGTTSVLSVSDHADFDFSAGAWTVDCWVYWTAANTALLFYQSDDGTHNVQCCLIGSIRCPRLVVVNGAATISLTGSPISLNAWHHIAYVENGDNYYIFVDGALSAYESNAVRPPNMAATIYIGGESSVVWF
jgi:hypothetical protein